jgi:hypothetical protein
MKKSEWDEIGRPSNEPFYIRHDPEKFPILNISIQQGIIDVLNKETGAFVNAYRLTLGLLGAIPWDPEGTWAASEQVMNVNRVHPGVYVMHIVADDGKWVAVSFIGWMIVWVPPNGGHEVGELESPSDAIVD